MAEGMGPPDDPFAADDPEAAERERRREEREARRRAREEGARRSLGERVSGALDVAGSAAEEGRERLARSAPEAGRLAGRPREDEPLIEEPVAAAPTGRERPGPLGYVRARAEAAAARPGSSHAEIVRRRLIAIAAAVAAVVAIVLIAAALGGDEEPVPITTAPALEFTQLTIPEGLTRTQIADLAKENRLRGSYLKASEKAPKGFDLKELGATGAPSLEGFLFPATYELEKRARASDLVSRQLEAFESNLAEVNLKKAAKKNLTPYDVVIIASMIEREVSVAKERRLVAGVIYNRLSSGEPLGIDATLRYELDKFDGQLLQSELDNPTPFNTRLNPGLPPTPIANPGLASLQAAADPATTDARFYVIKPGTCNEHFFTADAAEFEAAVAEYQAALAAEGGSPTDCPS